MRFTSTSYRRKPRNCPGIIQQRMRGLCGQSKDTTAVFRVRRQPTTVEIFGALYHWITCISIIFLVLAQLLGAVRNTTTTTQRIFYGRDPSRGPYEIVGTSDTPYTDRVVACVRYGRKYEPRLVSSLLASEGTEAILEDSTGKARHGYRLVKRRADKASDSLDSSVYSSYEDICSLISATLDSILGACALLGYSNLTTDALRVVDGVDSKRLFRIPYSLPVLIMPFWDNTEQARHTVPTWHGESCMFRLEDAYSGSANGGSNATKASLRAVNRTVRFQRTEEWLKQPGGVWKNGWYEDLEGGRWFADLTSSNPGPPYYMAYRMFDTMSGLEVDCSNQQDCLAEPKVNRWGTKFTTYEYPHNLNSIAIQDGLSYGLYLYETTQADVVRIIYDWETLVSNLSVILVLIRWILSLIALHNGTVRGKIPCYGGGLGCVSSYRIFDVLLFSMLPQLKMTLTAFWTVGCRFEGQQAGLSEAWFTIYPSIAQLMLMYYSLLNVLAKITRRRMTDTLFMPSVAFLCLIHYFRSELAASPVWNDIDGRVLTLVFSDEVKKMTLLDYFVSDLAWRMNGRVVGIFWTKLAVLGINLLPLLMARPLPIPKQGKQQVLSGVEKAFALRAKHVGGLGLSPVYLTALDSATSRSSSENKMSVTPSNSQTELKKQQYNVVQSAVYLNSYELLRLGYVVFGDRYIISFDDWDFLTAMAPLRSFYHLWNQRVCVWSLEDLEKNTECYGLRSLQALEPEMWRLDDMRLQSIHFWQISSCGIQC
ncbi:hypothetical protein F444_05790 [Phytophthora nicotianae P1976]|uniref:Uncharacterized protein n=1 Tax=Phytophthora nicotianae P1976 TaxID=1317066 RepID=A0A081AKW4_PHYNI|nr:hypothetical protein F444_05790 [Phytophthora nicotianae P1976]